MRRIEFLYRMNLTFEVPARRHRFQLRCVPFERSGQHIERFSLRTEPDVPVFYGRDGFGNTVVYGLADGQHSSFGFEVSGQAVTGMPFLPDTAVNAAFYKQQTAFTRPGEAIWRLRESAGRAGSDHEKALALMHAVRSHIAYAPASTSSSTTAEEAALQGKGVCQDHTQILLSLLRAENIPCRYAAGFLLGEGRTHAWAEAFIDGQWVGLDATNGMPAGDTHIVLAVGRDHSDCELNRGVLTGGGMQTQTVLVRAIEI